DFEAFDDRGHPAEANAFGNGAALGGFGLAVLEEMIHGGAAWVGDADRDVFSLFTEERRCARNGAAGADGADEAVDIAVAIVPDFRTGRNVVRLAVIQIVPLIGKYHAVLFGFLQLLGEAPTDVLVIVRIGKRSSGHFHELSPAEAQHVFLFLALRFRNNDHRTVAARIGDQCEANAGVAGGRLDDEPAGTPFAALFRFHDHLPAGAIFQRAARVHEFGLAEDGASGRLGSALKLDERCVADGFDNAVTDLHARFRD